MALSRGKAPEGEDFAMSKQIVFWWECLKEAVVGTIAWANAWSWLVGVAIVASIGYYGWGLTLQIPSTLQEYFTFALMAVGATWIVAIIIGFLRAPGRLYWKEREAKERAEARLRTDPAFEFVFDSQDAMWARPLQSGVCYYVGLHIIAPHTVDFPNVWIHRGEIAEMVAEAQNVSLHANGGVQIFAPPGGAIDPGVIEPIELFGMPSREFLRQGSPLNRAHRFTLEARGRHCRPCFQDFDFDPDNTPMLRMLT
jgi:hypothetical protein